VKQARTKMGGKAKVGSPNEPPQHGAERASTNSNTRAGSLSTGENC